MPAVVSIVPLFPETETHAHVHTKKKSRGRRKEKGNREIYFSFSGKCRLGISNLGLEQKYRQVVVHYGKSLESMQKLYMKHKDDPPIERDLPQIAGVLVNVLLNALGRSILLLRFLKIYLFLLVESRKAVSEKPGGFTCCVSIVIVAMLVAL